jgi:hypothetical protein
MTVGLRSTSLPGPHHKAVQSLRSRLDPGVVKVFSRLYRPMPECFADLLHRDAFF